MADAPEPPIGLDALLRQLIREEVARQIAACTTPSDEYLSTADAAALAHVVPRTIRRWIDQGKLERFRAGRVVRVRRADLVRLLRDEGRRSTSESPEVLAQRRFG